MDNIEIRAFHASDAVALSALFYQSVTQLGGRAYTAPQVSVWAAQTPTPAKMCQLGQDGRLMLVAERQGGLLAYGDLEPDGHVDHLYASPAAAGTGCASRVYQALEQYALRQGITQLYTEASELAKPFFAHKGFVLQKRRNLRIMGVAIHNYAMTKSLQNG